MSHHSSNMDQLDYTLTKLDSHSLDHLDRMEQWSALGMDINPTLNR